MNDVIQVITIVSGGIAILAALWKGGEMFFKYLGQQKLNRDLYPFFTPVDVKNATQYYVPTKCQNIAPSKEHEPGQTHAFATKEKLIPFFLKRGFKYKTDDQRFYIILADSGMGKTTFMINLYLRYVSQWFGHKCKIRLLPLGFPEVDAEINKIEDQENTILLLDAFDEDSRAVADYKKRMEEILKKVFRFRKVIFTCRTQFFPSEEEEPGETGILRFGDKRGYHVFHKLYLSPFDDKDIKKYIRKKFSFLSFGKKRKAMQIVEQSPSLMVRPMLLNNIDDLLASDREYEKTYQVYEELINRWIAREALKYREGEREGFKKELYKFSRVIAVDIYRKREARSGLFINKDEIDAFAKKHGIQLDDMEMKSRSLLNRNAQGHYKFSHKSILEYFLALEVIQNYTFHIGFNFEGMDLSKRFYDDLWRKTTFEFLTRRDLKGAFRIHGSEKRQNLLELGLIQLDSLDYLDLGNNRFRLLKMLKGMESQQNLSGGEGTNLDDNFTSKNLWQHLGSNESYTMDFTPQEVREFEQLYFSDTDFSALFSSKDLKQSFQKLDLSGSNLGTFVQMQKIIESKGGLSFDKDNEKIERQEGELSRGKYKTLHKGNSVFVSYQISGSLKYIDNSIPFHNNLRYIDPLKELMSLKRLDLSFNELTDIGPLQRLNCLVALDLSHNNICDIGPLTKLQSLQELDVSYNNLVDITPLKALVNLQRLIVNGNSIPQQQLLELSNVMQNCRILYDYAGSSSTR